MRYRTIDDGETVTYVVVCDPGDDAVEALTEMARRESLQSACAARTAEDAFAPFPRINEP